MTAGTVSDHRREPDLAGTGVVVTGAGRRGQVGEVVARTLAQSGARVWLVDRDAEAVTERAADLSALGFPARGFACDLTDAVATDQLARAIADEAADGLHALVHVAGGFIPAGTVADMEPDNWQRLLAINLTTAFVATRAFLPLLRRGKGSIVYFSAAAALPGGHVAKLSAYATAKAGILTLMRAVAAEERDNGVRANAIAPTQIRTDTNLASMGEQAYVERETVADWVTWLCSRRSGPVTGQVVRLG